MATTTTDLIAASRALDPAGRALLNLWLHRGLDDAAIAHLSGGSAADVAERRRQVVERLAREVGDTPEAVRIALDDLAIRPASAEAPTSPRDRRRRRRFAPTKGAAGAEGAGVVLPGADGTEEPPGAAGAGVVLPGSAGTGGAAGGGVVLPGAAGTDAEGGAPGAGVVIPGAPGAEEAGDAAGGGVVLPGGAAGVDGLVVPGRPTDARAPADLVVPGRAEPTATPDGLVVPGETETQGAAPDDLVVPDQTPPVAKPAAPAPPRTVARRSPIPATLGVALGLVIAGTVLAAAMSGGGGGGEERATPTPTPTATATPPAAERPQPLTPVPGGPDRVTGTMTLTGEELRLDVDGLDRPPGSYEVWLYNSIADAQPLGKLSDGRFRLPPEANSFDFLDVSLEGDRNRNHSGRSVLRAEMPR